MRLKSNILIFPALFLFPIWAITQSTDKEIVFPDIHGYQTLLCDFHMHTVFSDGLVWPTVRVSEAVSEGLDAICITDHLEYQSHSDDLSGDHNRSYEIAKPLADKKDLILIRGTELTKSMPPGHFNMLFVKDANPIDVPDWKESLRIANEQGAFVFWNHPGWRQEGEIPIWYKEHSWILSKGWIQGIEIVNENSYYPLAYEWAIDSNLTILGNSDIHDPLDFFFDRCKGEHRPVTLVFAKERTENGIREALDHKRTAIYYKNQLIGDAGLVSEIFLESIEIQYPEINNQNNSNIVFCQNNASIGYEVIVMDQDENQKDSYYLSPGSLTKLILPDELSGDVFMINNIHVGPNHKLLISPALMR